MNGWRNLVQSLSLYLSLSLALSLSLSLSTLTCLGLEGRHVLVLAFQLHLGQVYVVQEREVSPPTPLAAKMLRE